MGLNFPFQAGPQYQLGGAAGSVRKSYTPPNAAKGLEPHTPSLHWAGPFFACFVFCSLFFFVSVFLFLLLCFFLLF
jgi:hypothetical protein